MPFSLVAVPPEHKTDISWRLIFRRETDWTWGCRFWCHRCSGTIYSVCYHDNRLACRWDSFAKFFPMNGFVAGVFAAPLKFDRKA